ncbi:MAG: hypothetical protein RJA70_4275 [Pseudomonadota bacterium]|jgi:ATP-dependent RNA helicase DeaD
MTTDENSAEREHSFADLALPETVRRAIADKGYTTATPVQFAAFEPARSGKDLVVQARTGTGKTAAFGLPLIAGRVRPTQNEVQALILCPTRELAMQVKRELEEIAKYTEVKVVAVYGGAPMGKQVEDLAGGAHIVVGTPGRVLDHLSRKTFDPSALRSFVLDECDEMLSMGFLPQITDVWEQLPSGHQTLLFSATVPSQVSRIAASRLKDPTYITLSGDHIGALEIEHYFYLSHGDKTAELLQVIELEQPESAIIFCNTKDASKRVAKRLQDSGFEADWLNADLAQNERERVMARIRNHELRFLVCTDVAARGIDISHLTHVMNYDFPESSEQYVHRTGRTGRAGKTGTAIAFIEPSSIGDLYYLRLRYKIQPIERQLPTAREQKNREEADVLALLAVRFPVINVRDSYYSLAKRLLAHDQVDSILAGLLRDALGGEEKAKAEVKTARSEGAFRKSQPEASPTQGPRADSAPIRSPAAPASKAKPSERTETRPVPSNDERAPRRETRPENGRAIGQRRGTGSETTSRGDEPAGDRPADGAAGPPRDRSRGRTRDRGSRSSGTTSETFEIDGVGYQVSDAPAVSNAAEIQVKPGPSTGADQDTSSFVDLYINVGRRDGAETEDFLEALTQAGVAQEATGKITVRQRHSFVQIRPEQQEDTIAKLSGRNLRGREMTVEVARPRGED